MSNRNVLFAEKALMDGGDTRMDPLESAINEFVYQETIDWLCECGHMGVSSDPEWAELGC